MLGDSCEESLINFVKCKHASRSTPAWLADKIVKRHWHTVYALKFGRSVCGFRSSVCAVASNTDCHDRGPAKKNVILWSPVGWWFQCDVYCCAARSYWETRMHWCPMANAYVLSQCSDNMWTAVSGWKTAQFDQRSPEGWGSSQLNSRLLVCARFRSHSIVPQLSDLRKRSLDWTENGCEFQELRFLN
jgi:hypothetical protein